MSDILGRAARGGGPAGGPALRILPVVPARPGGGVSHRPRPPRAAGGETTADNLALACVSCSLRKWAKQTATDPDTGEEVPLFNPRTQAWAEHFRWEGERVIPLTPTGRATVAALAMNRPLILAIRQEEMARRRHPPA